MDESGLPRPASTSPCALTRSSLLLRGVSLGRGEVRLSQGPAGGSCSQARKKKSTLRSPAPGTPVQGGRETGA